MYTRYFDSLFPLIMYEGSVLTQARVTFFKLLYFVGYPGDLESWTCIDKLGNIPRRIQYLSRLKSPPTACMQTFTKDQFCV